MTDSGAITGVGAAERARYPPEVLQTLRGRRRREHTAFHYDSDDSSLSSNASGSNHSQDKGDALPRCDRALVPSGASGTGGHVRCEWRGRRRDGRNMRHRIAPDRYLNATYPFQVKFTPDELLNGSEWDTLSQEIWEKFVKSQQTEETFRKKMNLWRYLYITIKSIFPRYGLYVVGLMMPGFGLESTNDQSIFPRYGLYVVGSTMSGFGLEASDMDLCLYVRAPEMSDPRAHALTHLNHVLNYLRSVHPMGLQAELILAKVPLLKLVDGRHNLHVDLNCNNVVGIRNTNLLYCYSNIDWRVRPLVAVTKLWAQAHNINDARQRTLSSYSLTLMVIHFLQCGVTPGILPRGTIPGWEARGLNRLTLGELFVRLLRYYAEFPYERMAVSVRAGGRVPVQECRNARTLKNDPHQWKLLCVEEPFDLTNTARSVYDPETFERIVATFKDCYNRLSAGRRLADAWPIR